MSRLNCYDCCLLLVCLLLAHLLITEIQVLYTILLSNDMSPSCPRFDRGYPGHYYCIHWFIEDFDECCQQGVNASIQ
jgi:hypothetical protein